MFSESSESEAEAQKELLARKIRDLEAVEAWRGVDVGQREDLKNLIEGPLLSACEELYDKNIDTVGSSANKKDVSQGYAYITIDFETLSARNQNIGRELGELVRAD